MQVIHMDLKSKNILLDRDHSVAKITDVGLSRGMASSNKGFTPGTLEYSAPEVLLGRFCDGKVHSRLSHYSHVGSVKNDGLALY